MLDQDTARALLQLADETGARVAAGRRPSPAPRRRTRWRARPRQSATHPTACSNSRVSAGSPTPRTPTCRCGCVAGSRPGEVFDELLRRGEVVVHASDVERSGCSRSERRAATSSSPTPASRSRKINGLVHRGPRDHRRSHRRRLTASGERIGVGDKIATRRNDSDVDVANRETWTVARPASKARSWSTARRAGASCPRLRARARRARLRDHGVRRSRLDRPRLPRPGRRPHRRRVGVRRDDPWPGYATSPTSSPSRSRMPASSGSRSSAATAPTSDRPTREASRPTRSTATGRTRSVPRSGLRRQCAGVSPTSDTDHLLRHRAKESGSKRQLLRGATAGRHARRSRS